MIIRRMLLGLFLIAFLGTIACAPAKQKIKPEQVPLPTPVPTMDVTPSSTATPVVSAVTKRVSPKKRTKKSHAKRAVAQRIIQPTPVPTFVPTEIPKVETEPVAITAFEKEPDLMLTETVRASQEDALVVAGMLWTPTPIASIARSEVLTQKTEKKSGWLSWLFVSLAVLSVAFLILNRKRQQDKMLQDKKRSEDWIRTQKEAEAHKRLERDRVVVEEQRKNKLTEAKQVQESKPGSEEEIHKKSIDVKETSGKIEPEIKKSIVQSSKEKPESVVKEVDEVNVIPEAVTKIRVRQSEPKIVKKKSVKKVVGKKVVESSKPAIKKVAKKATSKATEKVVKKKVAQSSKPVAKKVTKKATTKLTKKVVKKTTKKVVKKAAKTVPKKGVKKIVKKVPKKAIKKTTRKKKLPDNIIEFPTRKAS